MSKHSVGPGREENNTRRSYADPPTKPRRKRVVLADSRAPVTRLRTVVELEEQTSYGEELVRQLIRAQFKAAAKACTVFVFFAALPVLFFFVPQLNDVMIAGVRLPWLALGLAPFPLLFGAGYWYNHKAERQERDFVAMVEK
jgi:hypothetical protein